MKTFRVVDNSFRAFARRNPSPHGPIVVHHCSMQNCESRYATYVGRYPRNFQKVGDKNFCDRQECRAAAREAKKALVAVKSAAALSEPSIVPDRPANDIPVVKPRPLYEARHLEQQGLDS